MEKGKIDVAWPVRLGLAALLCGHLLAPSSAWATATVSTAANANVTADSVGGSFVAINGPVLTEGANRDINAGTIVLNAPAGFEFNPAATVSVSVALIAGTNGALTLSSSTAAVSSSNITITVATRDISGTTRSAITWSGIRVRALAGTPLVAGNITNSGTASIAGVTASTSFGRLVEVGGLVNSLAFTTQPGGATAGAAFTTQPVVKALDIFGNSSTNGLPATAFVTVSLVQGTGVLQGTTNVNLGMGGGKGTASFSGLRIDVAGPGKQLGVISTNGLAAATSNPFVVNPAAASKLVIATQPSGTAVAGIPFTQQPVVFIEDAYNNVRSNDTLTVTAARSGGAGTLLGSTNVAAVGGVAAFSNLVHLVATNITIRFSSGSLTATTSGTVAVRSASFSRLLSLLPGESLSPGTGLGRSGTPSATAGSATAVRVYGVDDYYNLVASATDVVNLATTDPYASLPASLALVNGTNTLRVTFKTSGTQSVTVSDLSDGTKAASSESVLVKSGAFAKLQILVPGESAAPGTPSGKSGAPYPETSGVAFNATVNAVDANWNLISTNDTVRLTSSDGNAVLAASNALSAGTRSFAVTLVTPGFSTLTASDLTHTTIASSTSASIPVQNLASGSAGTRPVVAIHDSELTRALESIPATGPTPGLPVGTGFQWWLSNWHYFVMPEAAKEALRSDGTAFQVVSDADIDSGILLGTNGQPRFPILISLASEAIDNNEVGALTNYVAAGGILLAGSSAFTRNTDGTTRGDFAIGAQMGVRMLNNSLQNWTNNAHFSKTTDHRLVSHIPSGQLSWSMPNAAEEIPVGVSPDHIFPPPPLIWQVVPTDASVIAQGDAQPYLTVKSYGKGTFIYHAGLQPLLGHGGFNAGMYSYVIFRRAIEWAFENAKLAVPKVSAWPYSYDAALNVRHDFENLPNLISLIESSAQYENTNGVKGDYYFCTGTLRVEMTNSAATIASLRRAVTNYGATIGPHNGGLSNVNNAFLVMSNYDYWHWGPDEALDVPPSNLPARYTNGAAYALASLSNSFVDVEGWLSGITNGLRVWVSPAFNATREASYKIEEQLGVKSSGEQKLGPFPSWALSTSIQTPGKRYSFVSLPVSEWYVSTSQFAQSIEDGHTGNSIHDMVDSYYDLGGLINAYSHSSSTGAGFTSLVPEYIRYATSKPRVWAANAVDVYSWWLARSNAQVFPGFTVSNNQSIATVSIAGAVDPRTAVELRLPGPSLNGLQVFTNGVLASASVYRLNGQVLKVQVGTTVSQLEVRYYLLPSVTNDIYSVAQGTALTIPAPGVLANDLVGLGTNLTAIPGAPPLHGVLNLNSDGGFTYTPAAGFSGIDSFSYIANDGISNSVPAIVTIDVIPSGSLFYDNFARGAVSDPLAPWVPVLGQWTIGGGMFSGTSSTSNDYAIAYSPGNYTNFSVEGRIQFTSGGYAGGLCGRYDPTTGASYCANIYAGLVPPSLRLVKFHGWRDWSYTPMAIADLPDVGTNWHSLKLTMQGNRLGVFYDGVKMLDVTDDNFDGIAPFTHGTFATHMFMFGSTMVNFDDIVASPTPVLGIDDSYTAIMNEFLTVPAPGVLANDVPGQATSLTASLVAGATNGTVTLHPDGSFVYVPSSGYFGIDGFVYQVSDGSSTASAAVTINVSTNSAPPIANDDDYLLAANSNLSVAAPGLLANDTDPLGNDLSAVLISGPTNGTLVVAPSGAFTYTPVANFSGADGFTYVATDGYTSSALANVALRVLPSGTSFFQDFSGTAGAPTNIAPWVAQSGNWGVTNGALQGLPALQSYGSAFVPGNWGDYAVEAKMQLPAGAVAEGLAGRLNPATGARYAAWVYPEGSAGGSNLLRLIKFQSWTGWGYNNVSYVPMGLVNLSQVGTNWHDLKLGFFTNQVAVYFDGVQLISTTDTEVVPWLSGGIDVDTFRTTTALPVAVDDVVVSPLVVPDSYSMVQNSNLVVQSPGVLGNDLGVYSTNLSSSLVTAPTNGTLNLSPDGSFVYSPTPNFIGMDAFTYQLADAGHVLGNAVVTILVLSQGSQNKQDPPKIVSLSVTNAGGVVITWSSVSNSTYRVQFRNDFFAGQWTDLSPDIVASGNSVSYQDTSAAVGQRFYRVLLLR